MICNYCFTGHTKRLKIVSIMNLALAITQSPTTTISTGPHHCLVMYMHEHPFISSGRPVAKFWNKGTR